MQRCGGGAARRGKRRGLKSCCLPVCVLCLCSLSQAMLSIPFFDSLDLKHVKILRSFFTRRVYAPKEVVLAEGLPLGQQVFHIIINGRVEMCAKDAYGKRTVLQQFGAGDYFGELAWNANQDQVQPVTVYALQRTTILYTSSHQFAAALEQFPQLSVAINISGFAEDTQPPKSNGGGGGGGGDAGFGSSGVPSSSSSAAGGPRSLGIGPPIQIQLKTIPFFADIEELKLQQLAMLCEIKKKKAGTWICIQGADADGFYFILRGRVEVSARGFAENEDGSHMTGSGGGGGGGGGAHDKAGATSSSSGPLFAFGASQASSSPHQRGQAQTMHRGSGNSGTAGGGGGGGADNSPMFGGRARRSADLLSPHSPGTPLTAGFTPSPPSTPPQRPVPQSSSRKSNAGGGSGGGGGGTGGGRGSDASGGGGGAGGKAMRGASFSTSSTTEGSSSTRPDAAAGYGGAGDDSARDPLPPLPGAQNAYLDTLSSGDWFGEIALIEKTTRTASVRATQDCILLYLSRERFIRFLKFAPSIKSSALFSDIIRKRTANSLKSLPIFAPLKIKTIGPYNQFDERRLALLGDMFHFLTVPANTTLFSEGDFNLAFYIVVTGVAVVTAKSPTNEEDEIFLQELLPNDYFGESGLLHRMRCNATVKTKTPCLLLKLNGENFQSFLTIAPEVEQLFRQRLNMRTSDRLRSIPFFRGIRENKPWSKLDLLGALFTFEEFSAGELVFAQGSIGTKFYIIVAGEVEISIAKEQGAQRQVLDVLGNGTCAPTCSPASLAAASQGAGGVMAAAGTPGVSTGACYFGEISLLRRTARTASARCISPNGAVLLSIDSHRFQKFLRLAPELAEDFTSLLIHRTSNLLRSFDLFRQIQENRPWSKMEMIASLFEYELVESGGVIYKPGDLPQRFYVIASGTVRLESKWAGMQTLHSQSTFGSMELMQNIQNEKKFKAAREKEKEKARAAAAAAAAAAGREEEQAKLRAAVGSSGASGPAEPATAPVSPLPDAPALVLRTHTATAVDVCGLMWMSISSFKSLLSLAPEILPYFAAIAQHETRQVSEMAHAAHATEAASTPAAEKHRSKPEASAAEKHPASSGAATPQSPGTANSSSDSSSSPAATAMARGSISTLVLPPPSRGAVGLGSSSAGAGGGAAHKGAHTLLSAADSFETDSPSPRGDRERDRDRDRETAVHVGRARVFPANVMEAGRRASVPTRHSDAGSAQVASTGPQQHSQLQPRATSTLKSSSSFSPALSSASASSSSSPSPPSGPLHASAALVPGSSLPALGGSVSEDPASVAAGAGAAAGWISSAGPPSGPLDLGVSGMGSGMELEEILLDERASQLSALLARSPAGAHASRDLTDLGHLIPPSPPVLAALRTPSLALLPEVDLAASSNARRAAKAAKVSPAASVAPAAEAASARTGVPLARQSVPGAASAFASASASAAPAPASSAASSPSSSAAFAPAPAPAALPLVSASALARPPLPLGVAPASALSLPAAVSAVPRLPLAPSHSSSSVSSSSDGGAGADVEVDSEESTKAWLLASAFATPSQPSLVSAASSSASASASAETAATAIAMQPALASASSSASTEAAAAMMALQQATPPTSSLESTSGVPMIRASSGPSSVEPAVAPLASATGIAAAVAAPTEASAPTASPAPARIVRKRIVVSRAPFVPRPATLVS